MDHSLSIHKSILNATRTIHLSIKQFTETVDQQILNLQNFMEQQTHSIIDKFSQLKTNNQKSHSKNADIIIFLQQQQKTHIKTLINHVITSIAQQGCDQLKKITQSIISHFSTIRSLCRKSIKEIAQLSRFYQVYWPELNSFKSVKLQQQKPCENFQSSISSINVLLQRFGIKKSGSLSHSWGNEDNFQRHSVNMQFLQSNKIKSIGMKMIRQRQSQLLNQIKQLKAQICSNLLHPYCNSSQNNHKLQSSFFNSQQHQRLAQLYAELFRMNRHFVVYQVIAWPFLHSVFHKDNLQATQSVTLQQHKILQFKLQANEFSSINQTNVIQQQQKSIKQRLRIIDQCEIESLKQFQSKFINCFQHEINKEEQKFFQFGLITQKGELLLKTFPLFQNQSQKLLFRNSQQQEITKISIKIINISGKYFIQSLNQAKLIPLNPLWDYFGIKVACVHQQRTHVNMQFYGLINNEKTGVKNKPYKESQTIKNNHMITNSHYSEQTFLTIQFPPNLRQKVLKPFFLIKGFQCKITLKQDQLTTK